MISGILKHNELKVGDIVKLLPESKDPFTDTVVERIETKDGLLCATFFRPYVVPQESILGSHLINPLIGIERYTVHLHSGHTYRLMRRDNV